MKYIKVIGKFLKSKFMSATEQQATVVTIFAPIVVIGLGVN